MSSGIVVVETEAAMALPATPMLTGPKMIPSRADNKSSRWMIVTNLMRQSWHGGVFVGRGVTKMCGHVTATSQRHRADEWAAIAAAGTPAGNG